MSVLSPPSSPPGAATPSTRPVRRFAAAAGLVLSAVLLAGCGGSSGEGGGSGETRTVATPRGEVTVPAAPQRVVSLNVTETLALLEVGVTPVGTPALEPDFIPERWREAYGKITTVGDFSAIDLEKVGSLRPDLIVGPYSELDANRDQYVNVAPAVLGDEATSVWRERVRLAVDAVNKVDEGKRLSDEYDQQHRDFAQRHAAVLGATTFELIQGFGQGEFAVHTVGNSSGPVGLRDAGVTFGPLSSNTAPDFPSYSYEQLQRLEQSDAVLFASNPDGSADDLTKEMLEQPTFRNLAPVKAGKVFPMPYFSIGSYTEGANQLQWVEQQILPKLQG